MMVKLILLSTFMASFIIPSRASQYTLPVSTPIRFEVPGELIDVRKAPSSNDTTAFAKDEVVNVSKHRKNESNKRRRKNRRRKLQDIYDDDILENAQLEQEYQEVTRWKLSGYKRRWNRLNKFNRTHSRFPKKKLADKRGSGIGDRKSISPNRPGHGRPAGGRYRSVDPQEKKVKRHILRLHNILRSHVVPSAADMLAVGWYETAAEQAQTWAEQCGTHTDSDHPSVRWTSRYGACGQNVLVSPTKRRWSYVLRRWWSGRRYFRFGEETNNSSIVSAYTQMAWYNSHQLGCGFAECSTTGGSTFFRYVCNYCPSGNDPRRLSRPYTHGQSCRKCPHSCRSMCSRDKCKLCTNACTYSDLWVNCATLNYRWHEWLCNTKTSQGVERFKNCRATCQCMKRIT